jgi:hypothetical protein
MTGGVLGVWVYRQSGWRGLCRWRGGAGGEEGGISSRLSARIGVGIAAAIWSAISARLRDQD